MTTTTEERLNEAYAGEYAISLTRFGRTIGWQREQLIEHVKVGNLKVISRGKHLLVARKWADEFLINGGVTSERAFEPQRKNSSQATTLSREIKR
jgi:hypothetical protein